MSNLAARLAAALKSQGGRHATKSVYVPLGEWMPDLPPWANPGAITATNVMPQEKSYGPIASLTEVTGALTARCRGAIAVKDDDGNVFIYAGDATTLSSLVTGSFSDVSKVGGYTTAAESSWEFEQIRGTVIATNYDDAVQTIEPGGVIFSDLFTSTLKPKAKHIGAVGEFLMMGNTFDTTDGAVPHRLWWTALGNLALADPDASTQSDYSNLPAGGHIQRVIGGREYGVILCEKQIYRAEYVGAGLVFYIRAVDVNRGTPIPGSVVPFGRTIFYIADDGFYAFDGSQSMPIGSGKVDKYFWDDLDATNYALVSAAVDPNNKLVIWAYPSSGSSLPNKLIMIHWPTGRWAAAEVDTEILLAAYTQGYTLEELDAFGTLDTLSHSLDSRFWMKGKFQLAAFNQSHKLCHFTGANLAATIDTGEFQLNKNGRGVVSRVRPRFDGGTGTVSVAGRRTLQDTVTFGTAASLNSDGEASLLNDSMFHRLRMQIAAGGDWTHVDGLDVLAAVTSRR